MKQMLYIHTNMSPFLAARQINYRVGTRTLLHDVDLDIHKGEVLALIGPNGSGKSTLLKVLAGEISPDQGTIYLQNKPLWQYSSRELALLRAVMPQQTVVQFTFQAQEVVMMGRYPHMVEYGESVNDERTVKRVMAETESEVLAERKYPGLSGGEQGLVSLARVLAQETPLLMLDEPTNALDIHHQEMMMLLARRLAENGAAVLVIVHDLNLAARYADRLALLSGGHMAGYGSPWEILTESLVSEVFAHPITIIPHPLYDCPLIIPGLSPVHETLYARWDTRVAAGGI